MRLHIFFLYKQHVYKHASLGFPKKLSTSLSTPSGSDWPEATKFQISPKNVGKIFTITIRLGQKKIPIPIIRHIYQEIETKNLIT